MACRRHDDWTGIVLCGGKSTRMGGDKGFENLNGQPLLVHAIRILEKLCSHIMINSNNSQHQNLGYRVVPDLHQGKGPMDGIISSLKASDNEINLVLSCDMPFVPPELYEYLYARLEENCIAVPSYGDNKFEPVCGIYTKQSWQKMEHHLKHINGKLPDFFSTVKVAEITIDHEFPHYHKHIFFNINSRDDLEKAKHITQTQT